MDKTQLLERHFNAFINIENTRDFFIGMADYFDLANSYPEFENVSDDIFAKKKPLEDRLKHLQTVALEKLLVAHKEILDYVEQNKIEDKVIQEELKECQMWIDGHIVGSQSMPLGLHTSLGDVIDELYKIPEHKEFALKHIELYRGRPDLVNHYLPIKEVLELREVEDEMKTKSETELWGQLEDISTLYQTVKDGRERHRGLVKERDEKKTFLSSMSVLNHGMLIGEWTSIEEKRNNNRDPVFFNSKKIKPWLSRLHNYLLKELALGNKPVSDKAKTEFNTTTAVLYVNGKPMKIRRTSDQFEVLKVLFEDKDEVKREWFFDEVAEKIDQYAPKGSRKYYNACYQLNRKLAEKGFNNFFILDTHSVKITPHYLS